MALIGVLAVTVRYFSEFGKPTFQLHIIMSTGGWICEWVYCIS